VGHCSERISEILFRSRRKPKILAVLIAYIDESGTHQGSKLLTIGSCVGLVEEWKSGEVQFKRADKYSGVPFHAVDCAQGGKKFRGMSKEKRYRLYKKIVKVIDDHDIFGVASSASLEDYKV
jgi:hypothetical protein